MRGALRYLRPPVGVLSGQRWLDVLLGVGVLLVVAGLGVLLWLA